MGVDLILSGFLHFIEEIEYFGQKVLPLVRELEAQQATPVQQEKLSPYNHSNKSQQIHSLPQGSAWGFLCDKIVVWLGLKPSIP